MQTRKPYIKLLPAILLIFFLASFVAIAQSQAALPSNGFVDIVKKASPAVVHIRVEKSVKNNAFSGNQQFEEMFNDPFFEHFFGPRRWQTPNKQHRQPKQLGQGSGFIINKQGYILTNNHVVENADKITVFLSDKRKFKAKLVGTDPLSDVALIRIEDSGNLPTLPLGDSDALEVGELVVAIGNPFGLSQTVTSGVVSAKGRTSVGINEYENFIQTDAAINPGNSGGPLINVQGEVIGINSALYSKTGGYMGIGFAIPINMAKAIKTQLMEDGKVTRGWLGVIIQELDDNLAESFNLENNKGILVSEVEPDSPADKAGIEKGDVILHLNGIAAGSVSELRNKVAMLPPDSMATLDIIRDGKSKTIKVRIGKRPGSGQEFSDPDNFDTPMDLFGFSLQELTPELAERFGYQEKQGLLVSQVEPGSPAAQAGIQPGQLVEEINKYPVKNEKDLKTSLKKAKNTKKILLRIRAGQYSRYLVLTAE